MTNPATYLARMLIFLCAVAVAASLLNAALRVAFTNNPMLNSLILAVLGLGIVWNLRQVLRLKTEINWLNRYQQDRSALDGHLPASQTPPRLLSSMAAMLTARQRASAESGSARLTLSAQAMRGLLDGIASRLDESRELSRYMTGLLIFLGLLGTFWGLLQTVQSVAKVIADMSVGTGDVNILFEQLKSGLARPLAGMGTAFSASMFGLAGALVLGFLDLTAGQAQNRFYEELEEWLAGLTRLSSGALGEGDASVPVYVQALLEQTAENLENLQRILTRGEESRVNANHAITQLTERLGSLSDTMRTSQQLMMRVAESQTAIAPAIQRLADPRGEASGEAMRNSLRNIETALVRLVSEAEMGLAQTTAELRGDLRILTRTVANLAEGAPR